MAMRRMFSLVCDECGTGEDEHYGCWSSEVREKAKKDGWSIGNKDICPDCLEEMKDE